MGGAINGVRWQTRTKTCAEQMGKSAESSKSTTVILPDLWLCSFSLVRKGAGPEAAVWRMPIAHQGNFRLCNSRF